MAKGKSASKPDIAATSVYPAIARSVLFDLHENLLEMLESGLSSRPEGPKTLVVVGPGSEVVPFSANLDYLVRNLQGGSMVLLDYNRRICDGIPSYLEGKGFGGRFRIERVKEGIIDPKDAGGTIFIREWDIRDGYPLPAGSVDAIDMTVSIHHVTQYESDISDLFRRACLVLKDGGVVHVGEGDVDMKHSERKLRRIAADIMASGARGVMVRDRRYTEGDERVWRVGEDCANVPEVCAFASGMVAVYRSDLPEVVEHFHEAGYKQLFLSDCNIFLPLIDHSMEEDFDRMVVPVERYYREVQELGLSRMDRQHHESFVTALSKERSDAMRGVVEYYSPPTMICDALRSTGFSIQDMRYTRHGPFVNILARKD